ncbi:MAG: DUF4921 family protein [Halobacteriota archaeon]|nr:DUF4921 family protein [Halobacteriota archaeon]
MTEIRRHYFLDEYCIIAVERSRRPTDFKLKKEDKSISFCPFCPGNEESTPPAVSVYKDAQILKDEADDIIRGWNVRCFPNLYPALTPDSPEIKEDDGRRVRGFGFHEIIVETPDHDRHPADFTDEEIKLLLKAYADRVQYYSSKEGVKYTSLFRNHGKEAGASLSHPHTQIITTPILPPKIANELSEIKKIGICPYCDIAEKEVKSERLIEENRDWICFSPFFSKSPFEMWILPKGHVSKITEPDEERLGTFAVILRDALRKLKDLLDDPPYNYIFFQVNDPDYHMNIRIQPKISIEAGFEKGTDININTVSPEDAARYLREIQV